MTVGAAAGPGGATEAAAPFPEPVPDWAGDRTSATAAGSYATTRRWPPPTRLIALIAGFVLVAGGAALVGARFLGHGAPPDPARGAGHSHHGTHIIDSHIGPVVDEVWQLLAEAWRRAGGVSVLLEWDAEIPSFERTHREALRAKEFIGSVR